MARLEHANITVADAAKTAKLLDQLFGWKIRWQGEAIHGGHTIHVGSEDDYLALYSGPDGASENQGSTYETKAGLNHIGIVVDDLDAIEARVKAAGYEPTSHADYEPGRRFYFSEENGLEIEVISYD